MCGGESGIRTQAGVSRRFYRPLHLSTLASPQPGRLWLIVRRHQLQPGMRVKIFPVFSLLLVFGYYGTGQHFFFVLMTTYFSQYRAIRTKNSSRGSWEEFWKLECFYSYAKTKPGTCEKVQKIHHQLNKVMFWLNIIDLLPKLSRTNYLCQI